MVQQRVLNKTKRIDAYYKGSKPKSQGLAIENAGNLNKNKMNKNYFANLNTYIIQAQNLSGNY